MYCTWVKLWCVHAALILGHGVAASLTRFRSSRASSRAAPAVEELVKHSSNITIVQVGANQGDWNPKHPWDPVQSVMARDNVRALLIEPNPPVFKILQNNIHSSFGDGGRVRAMRCAVCANHSGEVSFYVLSARFEHDYPKAPKWGGDNGIISSMNRDFVLQQSKHLGVSKETLTSYIEEVRVPCKTPVDVLSDATLNPEVVDMLVVDAEGFDFQITKAFLQIPRFDPKMVVFEAAHLKQHQLIGLLTELSQRDYEFSCQDTQGSKERRLTLADQDVKCGYDLFATKIAANRH